MERYDRYKDSGIEWIGEIPEYWKLARISYLYDSRNTKVSAADYPALSVTMQGIVPQLESAAKTQDIDNRKLVLKGDFVINSRSDRRGSCGISELDGSVTLISNVLAPKAGTKLNRSYFSYLFKSVGFADEFYKVGSGIVDDLWSTNWAKMKNIQICIPPFEDQIKIGHFLDRKTSEIDSLTQKTEKSIELLQEYRKSVISEAVTKGLDPNVPMKDSGVEWIGEIPKDWDVARIKSIVRSVDEESIDVPLHAIMLEDIQSWTGKLISESDPNIIESNSRSFIRGDILFSKLRPYLAKASGELLVLRSTVLVHKFLFYFLLSFGFIDEINAATYGAKMPRANWNIVGLTFLSFPEKEEQIAIAEYLDAKTVEIDSLIEKKKQLVEKLQEYRKSLISECVTGKVKVPGVE